MYRFRLLIIEGDVSVLGLFANLFASSNYHVDTCNDGECAIRTLSSDARYDVILISYRVPGTNGVELVRLIRGMEHRSRTPVLMVSGSGDIEDEAFAAGVNRVLHKPLDMKFLLATVEELARSSVHDGDGA
ncbi:MAG TPA: response regulator [Blastocatellia bacterium]|nr:response regulator [Blastocatellia bacterium]